VEEGERSDGVVEGWRGPDWWISGLVGTGVRAGERGNVGAGERTQISGGGNRRCTEGKEGNGGGKGNWVFRVMHGGESGRGLPHSMTQANCVHLRLSFALRLSEVASARRL
jgi:hypothetical protein